MKLPPAIDRRMEVLRSDAPIQSARTGAIVLGVLALLLIMAVTQWVPFVGGSGRLVRAAFTGAEQVNHLTPVRVAGVEVGRVEGVAAGPRTGTSVVTMSITDPNVSLRSDASAAVRWRTVLGGNMYIDLQPGSPSAPPLGDAVIPASRTSSQTELDDLTQVLDGNTADRTRAMLRGLRESFAAPGAIGHTVGVAGPALQTIAGGLAPLQGTETGDLRKLVAATAKTVAGLGREPAMLESLVTGADGTLAVTDVRQDDLRALIAEGPSALDSTRTTMTRLRSTLDRLDPLVGKLQVAAPSIAPAADAATPALADTRVLLSDVRPLLRVAPATFAALTRASRSGPPLIRGLDPTIGRLNTQLVPYLDKLDPATKLKIYEGIGPFFSSLDTIASTYNDAGHLLQFAVMFGSNSLLPAALPGSPAVGGAVRECDAHVPGRARSRCAPAAQLLAKLLGGAR